jgi:hypothetical protein
VRDQVAHVPMEDEELDVADEGGFARYFAALK